MSASSPASSSRLSQVTSSPPSQTATSTSNTLKQNSSLYVYIFLAIFGIMLALLSTVVARSITLRRQRQATLAAISNDLPDLSPLGERPRMWQVYLEKSATSEKGTSDLESGWEAITPVSAAVVNASCAPTHVGMGRYERARLFMPFFRHHSPELAEATPQEIQLAALIAMPSQSRERKESGEDMPVLELGVADVRVVRV
ncbi:hypothetical protein BV25DRAFT_1919457 [Artomyces pyxidatus]|uniref:Uncharacterized protein n=1 Tax=Artomyces pyxidatus TaxID=48021 RepID=A0ACB8SP88_9AGAM|nr:hypothetical protein BV25DRAFT_1919457 [Artomyces pyxidatus]